MKMPDIIRVVGLLRAATTLLNHAIFSGFFSSGFLDSRFGAGAVFCRRRLR